MGIRTNNNIRLRNRSGTGTATPPVSAMKREIPRDDQIQKFINDIHLPDLVKLSLPGHEKERIFEYPISSRLRRLLLKNSNWIVAHCSDPSLKTCHPRFDGAEEEMKYQLSSGPAGTCVIDAMDENHDLYGVHVDPEYPKSIIFEVSPYSGDDIDEWGFEHFLDFLCTVLASPKSFYPRS